MGVGGETCELIEWEEEETVPWRHGDLQPSRPTRGGLFSADFPELHLCLDVRPNASKLERSQEMVAIPPKRGRRCVINLGVIATFASAWEQFSAVIPLFIPAPFLLHHSDPCTVTKQQLAEAIKQLNAGTGNRQHNIGCKCWGENSEQRLQLFKSVSKPWATQRSFFKKAGFVVPHQSCLLFPAFM